MTKPCIVLADLDANYIVPLENKLVETFVDQIDLEIITDKEYYEWYFSSPRKIDTLIVSGTLYNVNLQRHNISDIFVLEENMDEPKYTDNVVPIFKYSSAKEIINQILYRSSQMLDIQFKDKETQLIVVTSPIGGSGKTTTSLSVARSLANAHKRVFYLSTDVVQSFSFYMENKNPLPIEFQHAFNQSDDILYKTIKPFLRKESFVYLPPLGRTTSSLGLDYQIYNRIIKAARKAKEYDFIIVDTDIQLDQYRAEMINNADKVIINVLQDRYATMQTEFLTRNIDCTNKEKFLFVCNKFRKEDCNEYQISEQGKQFAVSEYIVEVSGEHRFSIENFVNLSGVKNLVSALI